MVDFDAAQGTLAYMFLYGLLVTQWKVPVKKHLAANNANLRVFSSRLRLKLRCFLEMLWKWKLIFKMDSENPGPAIQLILSEVRFFPPVFSHPRQTDNTNMTDLFIECRFCLIRRGNALAKTNGGRRDCSQSKQQPCLFGKLAAWGFASGRRPGAGFQGLLSLQSLSASNDINVALF